MAVLDSGGIRTEPFAILRIEDKDGRILEENIPAEREVLSPQTCYVMTNLLRGVVERGTGQAARALGRPCAGKTGTTNDYRDAWFLGYTSALTCGVWVGFDRPVTIIPHGYGSELALPVWIQVMKKAAKRYPARDLQPTMPMAQAVVCSISNALATSGCEAAGAAYQIILPADKIPTGVCHVHGGGQMELVEKLQREGQKAGNLPNKIFQSFRRFFGGKN
jgi:penicillin-binding protein 1A